MMAGTCRFYGRFRDLIPAGFAFHRLFAANYRCYSKDIAGHTIWVWQHHGGYVEIDDWYGHTQAVVTAVLEGGFAWGNATLRRCTMVRGAEGRIVPFDEEHDGSLHWWRARECGLSEAETKERVRRIRDQYRIVEFDPLLEAEIRALAAKGWIRP